MKGHAGDAVGVAERVQQFGDLMSQILTVPSQKAAARRWPSALKAMWWTLWKLLGKAATALPDLTSTSRTLPIVAAATCLPSGLRKAAI